MTKLAYFSDCINFFNADLFKIGIQLYICTCSKHAHNIAMDNIFYLFNVCFENRNNTSNICKFFNQVLINLFKICTYPKLDRNRAITFSMVKASS